MILTHIKSECPFINRHLYTWQFHFMVHMNCKSDGEIICCNSYQYSDVIMIAMASQITSLKIVFSTAYSGADQIKYQSSASLAFVRKIHRLPVTSPHKGPVTRKMFPFDDVIMAFLIYLSCDIFWFHPIIWWCRFMICFSPLPQSIVM